MQLISSVKRIQTGADPGFWERGGLKNIFKTGGEGTGGGVPPPVTARGSGAKP